MPCLLRFTAAFLAALLALGVMPTVAQDAPTPPQEIAEKAALCASCHGANGLPIVEKAPILFGQHSFYLLTQLRDFRAGRRASDVMGPIAKELSNDEMSALTKFFAAQSWPNFHQAADDADVKRSETLAVEAQCSQCHLARFLGDSRNPRVSNQKPDYLQKTLTDLRDNVRQNAAAMAAIVRGWSDGDIAAMSRYLAGL